MVVVESELPNAAHPGRVLQQSVTAGPVVEIGDTVTLTAAKALPKILKVVGMRSPMRGGRLKRLASTSARWRRRRPA